MPCFLALFSIAGFTWDCVSAYISPSVNYANQTSLSATLAQTATTLPTTVSTSARARSSSSMTSSSSPVASYVPYKSTGTCCYIVVDFVGVNSWHRNTANVTVATAITHWIQYDDTLIADSVSTVYATDATAIYGVYGQGDSDHAYTTVDLYTTTVTRDDYVRNTDDITGPFTTVPSTTTETFTDWALYTTVSLPSDIPTTLLNQSGNWYQQQWVGTETTVTFSNQSLIIYSPTPYFLYPSIGLTTDAPCASYTTATDWVTASLTTVNGSLTWVYSTIPLTTIHIPPPAIYNAAMAERTSIPVLVAQPFPTGTYDDWNYTAFIADNGLTVEGGGENVFKLPANVPEFLAGIPDIVRAYPNIGSCTAGAGQGQPTVHVPVNELTAQAQSTSTVNGRYKTDSSSSSAQSLQTFVKATQSPEAQDSETQSQPSLNFTQTSEAQDQQTQAQSSSLDATLSPEAQDQATQPQSTAASNPASVQDTGSVSPQSISTSVPSPAESMAILPGNTAHEADNSGTSAATTSTPDHQNATPMVITLGTSTIAITRNSDSVVVVGDQTASPGGDAITVGNAVILVPSEGTAIVVDGQTATIPSTVSVGLVPASGADFVRPESYFLSQGSTTTIASRQQITLGSSVLDVVPISVKGEPAVVIDGQTLTPGGAVSVSGQILTLATSGHVISVAVSPQPRRDSIAAAIMSVLDGKGPSAGSSGTSAAGASTSSPASRDSSGTTSAPAAYTGAATKAMIGNGVALGSLLLFVVLL